MEVLQRVVQSDATATVRLEVQVSDSLRQFEVIVIWQELVATEPASPQQWPEGWLEATAGSIDDPTVLRRLQGQAAAP